MLHARPDYQPIQDPRGIIPEDEPVFLIRGQDRCAPRTLRYYASIARAAGASAELVEKTLAQADTMEAWQMEGAEKLPDL